MLHWFVCHTQHTRWLDHQRAKLEQPIEQLPVVHHPLYSAPQLAPGHRFPMQASPLYMHNDCRQDHRQGGASDCSRLQTRDMCGIPVEVLTGLQHCHRQALLLWQGPFYCGRGQGNAPSCN
jgi:hypothetical protein